MTWVNPYFLRKIHKKYFKVLTGAIVSGTLALSMLGKNSADDILKYFSYFSQKAVETICMKY